MRASRRARTASAARPARARAAVARSCNPARPVASKGYQPLQRRETTTMTKPKRTVKASAAAALFLSGAVTARAEEKAGGDQVSCAGVNACKGQGSCAGAGNSCAGQNSCKGKGVVKTTAAEC